MTGKPPETPSLTLEALRAALRRHEEHNPGTTGTLLPVPKPSVDPWTMVQWLDDAADFLYCPDTSSLQPCIST